MEFSFVRRNLIFILVAELSSRIHIFLEECSFTNISIVYFITFEEGDFLINMKILGNDLMQMIISLAAI